VLPIIGFYISDGAAITVADIINYLNNNFENKFIAL
jgi:hypothetical protein